MYEVVSMVDDTVPKKKTVEVLVWSAGEERKHVGDLRVVGRSRGRCERDDLVGLAAALTT
jgi:hypothetical protein